MTQIVRATLAYLRASVGVMLQYRGEILLWAVWGLVNPAVLYAMWSAAAGGNADGTAAGFTRGQFAAYFFVMMIIGHLASAWDVHAMGYLIRTGQLSPLLLRPLLPLWKALAENVAYKVATLMFVVPMWCVFAWLVRPDFDTQLWQFAWGVLALFLAAVLNFVLGYLVSLIAFWVTKLDALGEVYFGLCMLLGGRFAPLDALQGPLRAVADVLPFRWMFAFPAELLVGRMGTPADAAAGCAIQVAWIVGFLLVFKVCWTAAIKRYTAVSG